MGGGSAKAIDLAMAVLLVERVKIDKVTTAQRRRGRNHSGSLRRLSRFPYCLRLKKPSQLWMLTRASSRSLAFV
jgi:hypothetical protein